MKWKTRASQMLGIKYPIIQGPFGGKFSSIELVRTISNLGGMGSFGLHVYEPEEILQINAEIRALTDKPYALNLWVPLKDDPVERFRQEDFAAIKAQFKPYFDELEVPLPEIPSPRVPHFEDQIEAILKARPPVMSFIFGIPPKEVIQELKKRDIITIGTVTTLEEALLVEEAGMNLVVASGAEAGGHRASFIKTAEASLNSTFTLIQQVVPKVKIPVIAAGGIADGKAIYSALSLGASAVQIGTAFLATAESNASEDHKARLRANWPLETTLTKVYTGRLARALSNRFSKDFENANGDTFAPYPIQSTFLSPLRKVAIEQNKLEYVAFWSGQPSVRLRYSSAAELFGALVKTASESFRLKS